MLIHSFLTTVFFVLDSETPSFYIPVSSHDPLVSMVCAHGTAWSVHLHVLVYILGDSVMELPKFDITRIPLAHWYPDQRSQRLPYCVTLALGSDLIWTPSSKSFFDNHTIYC